MPLMSAGARVCAALFPAMQKGSPKSTRASKQKAAQPEAASEVSSRTANTSWVHRVTEELKNDGWKQVKGTGPLIFVGAGKIQSYAKPQRKRTAARKVRGDGFVFRGSLMEGPDIDLLSLAGLQLTDSEEDSLWSMTNPRDLLLECGCIDETLQREDEERINCADKYFTYRAPNRKVLVAELREAILRTIRRR